MIDNVPLIQNANDVQQINASIIAMKKASRELDEKIVKLNSLNSELDKKIALLDSGLNKEIEDRKEAINSLDVASVGGSGKYISAISETDGKISATAGEITSSVSSGNSQPVTSGGVAEAINDIPYSKYTRLGANADMNNCTDVGTIYYSGSASDILTFINKPTFTNAGEMSLITIQLGAVAYLMQLYFAKEGINNSVAKRVYNNGTWSDWEKISTNNDISNNISNLTIHKIWGTLGDGMTLDVTLEPNRTYLYFNMHVYNIEMVLFSLYNGNVQTLCRLTNYNITDFLGLNVNTVRLTANGACRGFIFQIADTFGA